jgi:hypothetical protein
MNNNDLITLVQSEIDKAQQPLLDRIEELESIVDEMMDDVLVLNIMNGVLEKILPVHLAGEIAESLEAEIDMMLEPQRSERSVQRLQFLQMKLEKIGRTWRSI